MIVVMEEGSTELQVQAVIDKMIAMDFSVHRSTGVVHTVLGGVGPVEKLDPEEFRVMEGVKDCHRIMSPYKLAARAFRPGGTVVEFGKVAIGGGRVVVMAGPGSVEDRDQIFRTAEFAAKAGAAFLRGGAFQPRRSPYSFPGLGEEGLKLLREAADAHGLLAVSEVMEPAQIPLLERTVDLLQVGARNMQNYALLRELGKSARPVVLKRGIAATLEELLMSADCILSGGNPNVILCVRGIRTFDSAAGNTMDLGAIPALKRLSHLPVIADPSHGAGRRDQAPPMARAAVAAGADGLLIEIHPDPDRAKSDGAQSLDPTQFGELMRQLRMIAPAVGRTL